MKERSANDTASESTGLAGDNPQQITRETGGHRQSSRRYLAASLALASRQNRIGITLGVNFFTAEAILNRGF
jgi:hypothetical protein